MISTTLFSIHFILFHAILWVNACEWGELNVPEDGNYAVWVWTEKGKSGEVIIDNQKLSYSAPEKEKDKKDVTDYIWLNIKSLTIKNSQTIQVHGDTNVFSIVLSNQTDYNPEIWCKYARVLQEPKRVSDARVEMIRNTNTVFTMPHFDNLQDWESFAEHLRRTISIACGLFPEREKCPLNAKIFDKFQGDGFTVEKVYFESFPGFYVTGNLYRPVKEGKHPGVLCPHGHWKKGRFENSNIGSVPARCITMARMGFVVFSYDMVGYNDSQQLPHNWGTNLLKLWAIHPCAVQLWNSIRSLDFLQALPDVDPEQIACTGASGGGTQTFLLFSVEPRVKVSAPVNMISCSMQGGCICENAPLIRRNASNMEIGALMAPRPMILVCATGDWTRATPRVEYPAIRSIYKLYGEDANLEYQQVNAEHNYNKESREAVYRFFGKRFFPQQNWEQFSEPDLEIPPKESLRVFTDDKIEELKKAGYDETLNKFVSEKKSLRNKYIAIKKEQVKEFREKDKHSLAIVTGAEIPAINDTLGTCVSVSRETTFVLERWIISRAKIHDQVPLLFYRSNKPETQKVVLCVHHEGKGYFVNPDGSLHPALQNLMQKGYAIALVDLFLTGEHQSPFEKVKRKETSNYLDTFLNTRPAEQIQDIITSLVWLSSRRDLQTPITLIGMGNAGVLSLLAGAICDIANPIFADMNELDLNDDSIWEQYFYIPCIRSIGDIQNALWWIVPEQNCSIFHVHPNLSLYAPVAIQNQIKDLNDLVALVN
ncbi:MAG: acetylxylan esterase [Candidatus Hydrogenedens sp.]|nr:acetylxylan esterase [Candidatus Hydrogenedens sp.]